MQIPPVLTHFDENAETEMSSDDIDIGLGAVLVQKQCGCEKVIAFPSRGLSEEVKNYSASEKDCLVLIWAISKFSPYVYGRPFNVVTDHHALCWLANLNDPSGNLGR